MVNTVFIDGQRATPYMAYQLKRLKKDFRDRFGLEIYAVSGLRLEWEQIQIFLARYVKANEVRGRYVYDTRVWNGVRYYRISSAGTVAVPRTSNHEVQGTNGAFDFADSGSDAGVSRAGNERSNWLRANAHEYDMEPEGYGFGEPWHYKVRNIFNGVPGGADSGSAPLPSKPEVIIEPPLYEEDDMAVLVSSAAGQSLVIGGLYIGFGSPDDVRATFGDGVKVMNTSVDMHNKIATAFEQVKGASGLPTIVYSTGGSTIYLLDGGHLQSMGNPATIQDLLNRGAVQTHWPQGEIDRYLQLQAQAA